MLASTAYCQNANETHKLLYYVTTEDDFYIGDIQEILEDLTFFNSERNIYKEVNNLNAELESRVTETEITDYLKDINRISSPANVTREQTARQIACELFGYDFFLQIKIKPMPNSTSLSFAFRRAKVMKRDSVIDCKKGGLATFPTLGTNQEFATVVLDPSSGSVREQLIRALKKVNPESNFPPQVRFKVSGQKVNSDAFVPMQDSVRVEARPYDKDSRSEDLGITWSQIDIPDGEDPLIVEQKEPMQIMWFERSGQYVFLATANDQASRSEAAKLKLHAVKRPDISYIRSPVDFFRTLRGGKRDIPAINVYYRTFPRTQVGVKARAYPVYPLIIGVDTTIDAKHHELNFAFKDVLEKNSLSITTSKSDSVLKSFYTPAAPPESAIFSNMNIEYGQLDSSSYIARINPNYSYLQPGSYLIESTANYHGIKGKSKIFRVNMFEITKTSIYMSPSGVLFASARTGYGNIVTSDAQIMGKIQGGFTRRFSSRMEAFASVVYFWGPNRRIGDVNRINTNQLAYNLGAGMVIASNGAKSSDSNLEVGAYAKWYILPAAIPTRSGSTSVISHSIGCGVFLRAMRLYQFNIDVYPRIGSNPEFNPFNTLEVTFGVNWSWIKKIKGDNQGS
jgi:hypothetical protein